MDNSLANYVGAFVGAFLSILFARLPALESRFGSWSSEKKVALMLALNIVAAFVIAWGVCNGWLFKLFPASTFPTVACADWAWAWEVARVALFAIAGNQITFPLAKK